MKRSTAGSRVTGHLDTTRITKGRQTVGDVEVTTAVVVDTSACAKLAGVSGDSQVIGAFLEWAGSERRPRLELAYWDKYDRLQPCGLTIEKLLAEYFEIDLDKVEQERRALLEGIRR